MSLQRRRVNRESTENSNGSIQQIHDVHSDKESHKIAYDPEEQKLRNNTQDPKLTLMEEVLLMGLKDRQGYLSFWNDNISYALRGCILIELALRGKISVVDDSVRKRFDISNRMVEVIDSSKTGEALLDETLALMKKNEMLSIANWINLLSGETWNFLKVSYQLKQVRERLAKGLVDKGVLRTEMKNFFLFDMATHPVADISCKESIKRRVLSLLVPRTVELNYSEYFPESVAFKYLRTIALICAAHGANVLENVLCTLDYEKRDRGFDRADQLLEQFSQYPFTLDKKLNVVISVNLSEEVQNEINKNPGTSLQLEAVAGVLEVFSRIDSLL